MFIIIWVRRLSLASCALKWQKVFSTYRIREILIHVLLIDISKSYQSTWHFVCFFVKLINCFSCKLYWILPKRAISIFSLVRVRAKRLGYPLHTKIVVFWHIWEPQQRANINRGYLECRRSWMDALKIRN